MNATEITAEETMDQEVFSIEANEKNAVFRLAAGNITKAEVWVQEHREYSEEQLAKLRQAYSRPRLRQTAIICSIKMRESYSFPMGSMEGSRMTAVKLPSGSDTGAEVENAEMCRRGQ